MDWEKTGIKSTPQWSYRWSFMGHLGPYSRGGVLLLRYLFNLSPKAPRAAVRKALTDRIGDWIVHTHGNFTYRMTQIIMDFWSLPVRDTTCQFAEVRSLWRSGWCGPFAVVLSLLDGPALFDILGLDASDRTYDAVVRSTVNSSRFWTTLANFCEVMMKKKMQVECER